jgi:hypothetical protein
VVLSVRAQKRACLNQLIGLQHDSPKQAAIVQRVHARARCVGAYKCSTIAPIPEQLVLGRSHTAASTAVDWLQEPALTERQCASLQDAADEVKWPSHSVFHRLMQYIEERSTRSGRHSVTAWQ